MDKQRKHYQRQHIELMKTALHQLILRLEEKAIEAIEKHNKNKDLPEPSDKVRAINEAILMAKDLLPTEKEQHEQIKFEAYHKGYKEGKEESKHLF